VDRLRVAIPWNLPSYISTSGFQPLYQALFEDNRYLELRAIDEAALAAELERDPRLAQKLVTRGERMRSELGAHFTDNAVGRRFLRHVTPHELVLGEEIAAEVELHHTCPFTAGRRPFVLHCESFLPVFQPFLRRGMGRLKEAAAVRRFYAHVFSGSACLGIFSHIPQTLEQLSSFFANPEIDAKLHASPIGISERSFAALSAMPRAKHGMPPVFLFTGSSHRNPGDFARRGGAAALRFAEGYLRSGRDGRFIFRGSRPSDVELAELGIDAASLAAVERRQVSWIEERLPVHEHLRLFGLADFVLLPSVNLHSTTIMHALAAGAVPVVTDTIGTDVYVRDGVDGIVLTGMREAAWHVDGETGVLVDADALPEAVDAMLAAQMVHRVGEVLDTPGRLELLRTGGRESARTRFSGARFCTELSEEIVRLWRERGEAAAPRQGGSSACLQERGVVRSGSWERYFTGPSQPSVTVDVGSVKVYAFRGVYYLVPGSLDAGFDPCNVNPLTLRIRGLLRPFKIRVAAELEGLFEPLFLALNQSGRPLARFRYFRLRMIDRAKAWLRPYRRLYVLVRASNRLALRVTRSARRLLSGPR